MCNEIEYEMMQECLQKIKQVKEKQLEEEELIKVTTTDFQKEPLDSKSKTYLKTFAHLVHD